MKNFSIFKIFLLLIVFILGCNYSYGQDIKSVMVKGETYAVTSSMVYKASNVISKTNFINKSHFTATPKNDIGTVAKKVFSNERITSLKKTKDAVLINFYLDKEGKIQELSFNVSHAPNITVDELKALEDYLFNNYSFDVTTKDTSSTYLVGIALWFNRL